ncbi:hypothetical protein [Rufibacter tibetensis]|uniref:Acyltransferase 3 domain-containing protein n=1 Tax=Rufibacter tibetensis TaxID=512763 RepID=A0A0P0CLQ7_9BACT|nr:hypothetical protein [Rufibacter tibetensis]ALI97775.1 hypothetical protein DC20_00680 [Rufibacter tibetensis]
MKDSKRLVSFDLLRIFFVLLALVAHFRISQGVGFDLHKYNASQSSGSLNLPYLAAFTRSSMSALLIIFGFMIEYVYANIWKTKGGALVTQKMLTRAVICYLAFVAVASLAIMAVGGGNFKILLGTISFAYVEHGFAFLFKYYTFLIPIVLVLMWIRFKYGWYREVLTVAGLLVVAEGTKALSNGFPAPFEVLGKNLFGVGNEIGPSILHSLVLVVFGGLAANYTINRKADVKTCLMVSLAVLSVVAIGTEIYSIGFDQFVIRMASTSTYRAHNSYVYFAFGILSFLSFWFVSWVIVRHMGNKLRQTISYYGGNTFIIFLYGNILILFVPKFSATGLSYSVALATCLFLSLACVNLYDWSSKNLKIINSYNLYIRWVVSRFLVLSFGSTRLEHIRVNYTPGTQGRKAVAAVKARRKSKEFVEL